MTKRPSIPVDYKPKPIPSFQHRRRRRNAVRRWLAVVAFGAVAVGVIAVTLPWTGPSRASPSKTSMRARDLALPPGPPSPLGHPTEQRLETRSEPQPQWQSIRVRPGDNLAAIFSRLGLAPAWLQRVVGAHPRARALRRLYPGDELRIALTHGRFHGLAYQLTETERLRVTRSHDDSATDALNAAIETTALQREIVTAHDTIDDSFYRSASRAGLSDRVILELARIYGWEVDFARDIRPGDRFSVVYERVHRENAKPRDGRVLAAELVTRGRRLRALRFETGDGRAQYYTPDGENLRGAFLRAPLDFTRVSSTFSASRKHPILGRSRAHEGVDYAAPRGTPVRSTADGRIAERGTNGGYGKTIAIDHPGDYGTLYAHLSGYARGIAPGRRVDQGQVIGYVGASGLATGPHLHYELRVDGRHRDPLNVELPKAPPLPRSQRAQFRDRAERLVARLDALAPRRMAEAGSGDAANDR